MQTLVYINKEKLIIKGNSLEEIAKRIQDCFSIITNWEHIEGYMLQGKYNDKLVVRVRYGKKPAAQKPVKKSADKS
jgi:uncharacterized protein YcfJ